MKAFFKIFGLIFGWKGQVEFTKAKYSKNLGERIGATVVLCLFVAGSLACEFWMMAAFKQNIAVGIIALILLCAVGATTIKLLMLYSAAAFAAAKEAKKFGESTKTQEIPAESQQQIVSNDPLDNSNNQQEEKTPVEKPIKTYRTFDITMGIIFMVLALGLLATLVAIPVLKLKALAK